MQAPTSNAANNAVGAGADLANALVLRVRDAEVARLVDRGAGRCEVRLSRRAAVSGCTTSGERGDGPRGPGSGRKGVPGDDACHERDGGDEAADHGGRATTPASASHI